MNEDKNFEYRKHWHKSGWAIKLLALALTLFVLVKVVSDIRAFHYIGETNGPATITVSGTGDVVATPNIATVDFSVTNQATSVATAQAQTTTAANAIIAFLEKNGVASADIQTTDYEIYPQYNYVTTPVTNGPDISVSSNGTQVLAGYDVSETMEVKIRDLSNAGTILAGIGTLGATGVSGLSFTEDNYDDLVKQAEASAINDAKSNAATLAKNLGVKIVRLVSYSDQSQIPRPIMYAAMASNGSAASVAPEISAGQNKITANVTLVYEVR